MPVSDVEDISMLEKYAESINQGATDGCTSITDSPATFFS
jgi:hypothetical protein